MDDDEEYEEEDEEEEEVKHPVAPRRIACRDDSEIN